MSEVADLMGNESSARLGSLQKMESMRARKTMKRKIMMMMRGREGDVLNKPRGVPRTLMEGRCRDTNKTVTSYSHRSLKDQVACNDRHTKFQAIEI